MKSWTDKSSAPLRRVKKILRFLKVEIDSGLRDVLGDSA